MRWHVALSWNNVTFRLFFTIRLSKLKSHSIINEIVIQDFILFGSTTWRMAESIFLRQWGFLDFSVIIWFSVWSTIFPHKYTVILAFDIFSPMYLSPRRHKLMLDNARTFHRDYKCCKRHIRQWRYATFLFHSKSVTSSVSFVSLDNWFIVMSRALRVKPSVDVLNVVILRTIATSSAWVWRIGTDIGIFFRIMGNYRKSFL